MGQAAGQCCEDKENYGSQEGMSHTSHPPNCVLSHVRLTTQVLGPKCVLRLQLEMLGWGIQEKCSHLTKVTKIWGIQRVRLL